MHRKKVKGTLPSNGWLMENGKAALVACMHKYPEMFSHILQNKLRKTIDEWVSYAEKLEKKYGKVPSPHNLRKIKPGLIPVMKQNHEKFSHIKQDWKQGRSVAESVIRAEQLEKEYGILPYSSWLIDNGEGKLYRMIKKYPEYFSHIKQECKKGRTLEESIKYAETLASENGGKLPNCSSLTKNGNASLYAMIKNHKKSFSHIEIEKTSRDVYDAIDLAAKLQIKHTRLPQQRWLRKNGHGWIINYMARYPDQFKHIKKENPSRRTVNENIELAEKIAKENGGVLPKRSVLSKKYSGVATHIRKYPKKFAHIKQEYAGGRNSKENLKLAQQLIRQNEGILPKYSWLRQNGYGGLEFCIRLNPDIFKGMKMECGNEWNKGIKIIGE